MSSKWKYANLPANERIELVRSGNSDVYNSEMERTKEVIRSREALGLDTTAQVKWADTLGYNFNLANAQNMGISADKVNKTGYGERLLSSYTPKSSSSKDSGFRVQSGSSLHRQALGIRKDENAKKIKNQYAAYKKNAIDSMKNSLEILREDLINEGANVNGGKMITQEIRSNAALADTLSSIDLEMQNALVENDRYYDELINQYNSAISESNLAERKMTLDEQKFIADTEKWKAEFDLKQQDTLADNEQAAQNAKDDKDKWQSQHELDKEKEDNNKAQWEAQHAFDVEKENTDNEQWEKEHALDVEKEQNRNEQWKAEHELDVQKEANDVARNQAKYGFNIQKEQTDFDIWLEEKGYTVK